MTDVECHALTDEEYGSKAGEVRCAVAGIGRDAEGDQKLDVKAEEERNCSLTVNERDADSNIGGKAASNEELDTY